MPSIGRFVEEDTDRGDLENSISLNRYVHCYNNPMFYVDRDEHRPVSIGAIVQQRMDQYGSNGESVRRTEDSVIVTIRGKEKEYYFSLADHYGLGEVYFNEKSYLTINHEQLMKDFGLSKEQATITTSDYLTNKEFATVSGMLNYYPDSIMNPIELYIIQNDQANPYNFICQNRYNNNNRWLSLMEKYTLDGENLYKNDKAVGAIVNLSAYEIYIIPKKTAKDLKSEHERNLRDIEYRYQDYKPLIGKSSIEKRAIEEENERYAKQQVMMIAFNACYNKLSKDDRRKNSKEDKSIYINIENYKPEDMEIKKKDYQGFLTIVTNVLDILAFICIVFPEGSSSALGSAWFTTIKAKTIITVSGKGVGLASAAISAYDGEMVAAGSTLFLTFLGPSTDFTRSLLGGSITAKRELAELAATRAGYKFFGFVQGQLNEVGQSVNIKSIKSSITENDIKNFYDVMIISLEFK